MAYRPFGGTGLKVGPLALGTVNFSWLTDEAASFAILDAAFERGINLIDTSDNYNAGQTEALLGRWFALGGRPSREERSGYSRSIRLPTSGAPPIRCGARAAGSGPTSAASPPNTSSKPARPVSDV